MKAVWLYVCLVFSYIKLINTQDENSIHNNNYAIDKYIRTQLVRATAALEKSFEKKIRVKKNTWEPDLTFDEQTLRSSKHFYSSKLLLAKSNNSPTIYAVDENHIFQSNDIDDLEPIITFQRSKFPVFMEVITWKTNITLFLVKFENDFLYVYQSTLDRNPVQTIKLPIISVHCFHNNNISCIFITQSSKGNSAVSLFKWIETHFDVQQSLQIPEVSFSVTFQWKSDTLILLVPAYGQNKISLLLKWNGNSLTKMQNIKFQTCPNCLKHVVFKSKHYIVSDKVILAWNGHRLVQAASLERKPDWGAASSVGVWDNVHQPLVFAFFKHHIVAFKVWDKFRTHSTRKINENMITPLIVHLENDRSAIIYTTLNKNFKQLHKISFTLDKRRSSDEDVLGSQADPLMQCFNSLQNAMLINRDTISKLEVQIPFVLRTDIPQNYSGVLKSGISTKVRMGSVSSNQENNYLISPSELLNTVVELQKKAGVLNDLRHNLLYKSRPNTIPTSLYVPGGVSTVEGNLGSALISVATGADGIVFLDRPSLPDSVESVLVAQSIKAQHLYTGPGTIIDDLLFSADNQKITGKFTGTNIILNNILPSPGSINNIPIDNIVPVGSDIISGIKSVQALLANNLDASLFNQVDTLNWINNMNLEFDGNSAVYENVSVKNLNIEYLNGIKWNDFLKSLYLDIDGHSKIKGDLLIRSRTRSHEANLQSIFGIPVENMLTKTTDQVVTSNLTISSLHASEVQAGFINGLHFKESVALPGSKIKNVEIEHLDVENDLTLNDNSLFDKQIDGTKLDELLQIYNGKVLIKGSVLIPNLHLEADTKVLLQNNEVHLDIPGYYWSKAKDQEIKTNVTFTKSVEAPQVYLEKLNLQDWSHFITTDGPSAQGRMIFEKTQIEGNLFLDRNNNKYNSQLQLLNNEAVRVIGKYEIQSDVEFTGEVNIKNAHIKFANNLPVSDLIWKSDNEHIHFIGRKTVPYLNVSTLSAKDACVGTLNGVDLKGYFDNLLTVDKPAKFGALNIDTLAAEQLNVETLNVVDAANVDSKYRTLEYELPKSIRIKGDVHIDEIDGLELVNDIKFMEYLAMVIPKNLDANIKGHKVFEAPITILQELNAPKISGVDLHDLHNYGFSKTKDQNITGQYKIRNIKTENVYASSINNVNADELIDISTSTQINSHIWFKAPLSVNKLTWSQSCYVNESSLYEMPDRKWKSVYIQNHLQHQGLNAVLKNLVENAVTQGFNKSITGKVTFVESTSFEDVISTQYINNVHLENIRQDALLVDNNLEVKQIKSAKTFVNRAVLLSGKVSGDFDAPMINGFKIKEINDSLVWQNEDVIVKGVKTLKQSSFVDHLKVEGSINGVMVDDVVFFDNNRIIPNTIFNSLNIKNSLQIEQINDRNFDEFLSKRIRLYGEPQNLTAHIQFANLNVKGASYITKINNLSLNEIVFADIPFAEPITGLKVFEKGLHVNGDILVNYLNNYHLRTIYSNSVRKNSDYYISHVIFNNLVHLLNGLHVHSYENETWLNFYAQPSPDTPYAEIIEHKLNYTFSNIKPYYYYLYLEPSDLSIPQPPSKKVKAIRPGFLHLWEETSGEVCSLPSFCTCLLQYTIDISNQRSIAILPSNATHRFFSYYDSGIGINVFTSSVSTNSFCSTANEEFTYVTWMKLQRDISDGTPIGDITIDERYYNGYLSDVKFFRDSIKRVFLVLAIYYDKSMDSHDTNSLLLQLNTTTSTINAIQYIPTSSAKTLELLQSPFGTHLVICNAVQNEDVQSYFEILKFDEEAALFKTMRTVSTEGCGLIASAVFGKEQFIFIGDENYKILRINRYIEHLDAFYYFQSFIYDSFLRGLHIFYPQNSSKSEVLLCVTTDNGNFYIYDYTYIEGWKQISTGYLKNAHDVTHFKLNHEEFLFMSSTTQNMIFRIIRQGIP